jgi:hypothetical protein
MEKNKNVFVNSREIYKDYTEKIKNKLPENLEAEDINQLISFFNYSFQHKNDFFVKNFNKRVINNVYLTYNKIKTNILTEEINDLFEGISIENLKLVRFILINFVNNYEEINFSLEYMGIDSIITKNSMEKCLTYLNKYQINYSK